MFKLHPLSNGLYLLPKQGNMRVPGLIIASEKLLREGDYEHPLQQVCNVAQLKGIEGYSIAMPDMHWGYGFPIGGVAATCGETGVISPGGVGYDINCGVRLAVVPLKFASLTEDQKTKLLQRIFNLVPSGVGHGHKGKSLSDADYNQLLLDGAKWSVAHGFGFESDLDHIESFGKLRNSDPAAVSQTAKDRGRNQLGSIGSGNHFIEIGAIDTLFLPEIAKTWGIIEGDTYILIHTGSRGFGHQVCQDTLDLFIQRGFAEGLPDRQLVAAPISSPEGKQYFHAMAAAANYAFNNRQQILHFVRVAFFETLGVLPTEIKLIYDVCHNIAKFETYEINGSLKRLCVHRKGATRAFGPHSEELPPLYRYTGQPVLVPGDMGRASYLMVGCGLKITWCSACHGAGRDKSRIQSSKNWQGKDPLAFMEEKQVKVMATSTRTITEEMPDAYKNVDDVVDATEVAGLAKKVARLRPHLVIKG